MISVTQTTTGDYAAMHALFARTLATVENKPLMGEMLGAEVVQNIQADIAAGGGVGRPIPETAPFVAQREGKGHRKGLVWTGRGSKSVKAQPTGSGVSVGTDLEYFAKAVAGGPRWFARKLRGGLWDADVPAVEPPTAGLKGYGYYRMNTKPRPVFFATQRDMDGWAKRFAVKVGWPNA